MRALMAEFGITRLARLTGLDNVGVPVWSAIRPNSRTLAQSQGKGVDDPSAMASAVMEAVEVAICGVKARAKEVIRNFIWGR